MGGGVKGHLKNVKKTDDFVQGVFPKIASHDLEKLQ